MFEQLLDDSSFWSGEGSLTDVVLSSRLRLARNQASLSFPDKREFTDHSQVEESLLKFIHESKYSEKLKFYRMSELEDFERRFLRERNIITEEMENNSKTSLVFQENQHFNVHINSKDHFRIQIIRSGMSLYDIYRDIVDIDNELNSFVDYAFNDRFGYLTSSLEDTGTGLKASVLLHLPILSTLGTINDVKKMSEEMGAAFEGVTVETNRNYGSFYQISNKKALGKSEVEIIEMIDDIVSMISNLEAEARDEYIAESMGELEDRIWRSYGILKYSRSMSYVEALEYLSNIRLGIVLYIIKDIDLKLVQDLFVKIQTAHLIKLADHPLSGPTEYDLFRAKYIRSIIA